jgi:PBSX family phage terminase large subunit
MELTLHAGQARVIDSPKKFIAAISGVQGGKTTVGALWLMQEIYRAYQAGKTGDWLIAAPTVNILQQSTLPKFKQMFPQDWGVWREARRAFELSFGGYIYVRSTDIPEHLEGMTLMGAWLDEAGMMKEQVWVNIQGRLSINQGRCVMTSTPYANNWLFREVYKKRHLNPDLDVITWVSTDNPRFAMEEFERAKKTLSPEDFAQKYMGQFVQREGLVYNEFEPDLHVIPAFEIPASWNKFAGLDFGYSMPTAVICIAEDPETNLFYVYKEYYKTEPSLKGIAQFIQNEGLKYILADSQGAQQIAELQRYYGCRNIHQADKSVDIGIQRIRALLKQGRIKFFEGRCVNTIDEMETYHYAANSLEKADGKDKPVKKHDHAMDALRYAFSKVTRGIYPEKIEEKVTVKQRVRARMNRLASEENEFTAY